MKIRKSSGLPSETPRKTPADSSSASEISSIAGKPFRLTREMLKEPTKRKLRSGSKTMVRIRISCACGYAVNFRERAAASSLMATLLPLLESTRLNHIQDCQKSSLLMWHVSEMTRQL